MTVLSDDTVKALLELCKLPEGATYQKNIEILKGSGILPIDQDYTNDKINRSRTVNLDKDTYQDFSNTLKNYMNDGNYSYTYISYPKQNDPNKYQGNGNCTIYSQINSITNEFIQKNINFHTVVPIEILVLHSFSSDSQTIYADSIGSTQKGKIRFDTAGNLLGIMKGFSYSHGEKMTATFEVIKTETSYTIITYDLKKDCSKIKSIILRMVKK